MVALVAATGEGESVAVGTEVNGAAGNSSFEDHAVSTSTAEDFSSGDGAGEQRRSDPASPETALLLTPAEKFRVSLSAPPVTVPPDRSAPKETESLPAPPPIVESLEVLRRQPRRCRYQYHQQLMEPVSTNREREGLIASTKINSCSIERTSDVDGINQNHRK